MPVISVENVSKRYRKGSVGYHTLREDLYDLTGRLVHLRKRRREDTDENHIWALRDVSFQIEQGERVGIIGRNGSGKTTLLRLLAGITRPTHGKIASKGRIGVLIELMAGFHPELTGRENIYLNGAIMGMSHNEIKRKFDEIVAFAELEKFIDTPIKRYSSGMHVRLGFAVAAHLEPQILLIDEVLAVGDAAFQQKCLGKMGTAADEGRTVVFVSHNMTAVQALCSRGILLDSGQILEEGDIAGCINRYMSNILHVSDDSLIERHKKEYGFERVRIRNLGQSSDLSSSVVYVPGRYAIEFVCRLPEAQGLNIGFTIINNVGIPVASSCTQDSLEKLPSGNISLWIELAASRLPSGEYHIQGAVWDSAEQYDQSDSLLAFSVVNKMSSLDVSGSRPRGVTLLDNQWQIGSLLDRHE